MEYVLNHIEGNEYELSQYGTVIATIYTRKDTYAFDIKEFVKCYNENHVE